MKAAINLWAVDDLSEALRATEQRARLMFTMTLALGEARGNITLASEEDVGALHQWVLDLLDGIAEMKEAFERVFPAPESPPAPPEGDGP
jgi:hypothetical protein